MASKNEDLRADLDEFRKLLNQSERVRVKDILSIEIRKIETEISNRLVDENGSANASAEDKLVSTKSKTPVSTITTKIITNYAWDQSDKFFKFYVTLNGVQNLEKEKVVSEFTETSMKLNVKNLNDEHYSLSIVNLQEHIVPSDSYHKVKSDMVLIMLKKKDIGKKWSDVTRQHQKTKEAKETKKSKVDDSDPNAGLMDLMKKMYDDGDDDMKRTINKAWSESQSKNSKMGMDDMPGMS